MINIGTTTISDLSGYVGTTVGALLPIMAVIISVPLSFFILRKIIALFPKR